MQRIAVLTSGGDAPGMNACIRAVVRTATFLGLHIHGIRNGFAGLMRGEITEVGPRDVSNLIQRGGTVLGTSRCSEFLTAEGRFQGVARMKEHGIEGLVAIGGDGTFRGLHLLVEETGFPSIGVPGTIDNDLYGSDYTIGYDTAVNTALDAIDKLRDTAASHSRIFFVEVMGRRAGFIALETAVAGGAEEVIIPEEVCDIETICARIRAGIEKGKKSSIIVVAEGDELGGAEVIARQFAETGGFDIRTTILGHIQRGGSPTSRDRVLASRLGAAAVEGLRQGLTDVMAGEVSGRITYTPLPESWSRRKPIDSSLLELARNLAT
jgi:6-phosphofructokinase 1